MSARDELYAALFALHERLLGGDPTLLGEVARLVLEPLLGQLRNRFREIDDQVLQEKSADALLEYGKQPDQANATTGAGVMGFLFMRAQSRVLSRVRRDRRREQVEGVYAHGLNPRAGNPVELRAVRREHPLEDLSNAASIPAPNIEDQLELQARVEEVLAGAKSEVDLHLLKLMFAGVRETTEYARVLGIEDQSEEERERIVKRHKDRLMAAARRREEAKRSGPKRRGRPPRQPGEEGGDRE